jgi:acyl-CoA thioesterase
MAPGQGQARDHDHHGNAVGVVHGGAIFSLADLVFAVASNSHGTVALGVNVAISYMTAARGGTLVAEAEEVSIRHLYWHRLLGGEDGDLTPTGSSSNSLATG